MTKYALEIAKSMDSEDAYYGIIMKDDGLTKCVHDIALADNLDDLQDWFAERSAGVEYAVGRDAWHQPDALTVWECVMIFVEN